MPSEKDNNCVLLGKRETIRFLKENKMDIMKISRALKDKPGAEPKDYWQKVGESWSFYIKNESSLGMEICFCTKYVAYAIPFFEFLLNKFPDLYIRAEYHYHNRDCCYEGFWVGKTVEGEVKIQELFWEDENVHGCYAAPDAYSPYWYSTDKFNTYLILDRYVKIDDPTDEKIHLEVLKILEKDIRSYYIKVFESIIDDIEGTYQNVEKTPEILEILNKIKILREAKNAEYKLEEEYLENERKKLEEEKKEKKIITIDTDDENIQVIASKKKVVVKKKKV